MTTTDSTLIYRAGSDFRLGGRQYDTCPHDHATPEEALECDHFARWYAGHPVVAVEMTTDGMALGVIESDLVVAAKAYAAAVTSRDGARDALADAVRQAVASGMPETQAAHIAGVNRMTVRKWLGK